MPKASTTIKVSGRSLSEVQEEISRKISGSGNGNGTRPDIKRICTRCNLDIPPNDYAVIFCDDDQNPEMMYDDHFRHKQCFKIMVLDRPQAFGLGEDPSDEQVEGLLEPCKTHQEYKLLTSKVFPSFIAAYPIEKKISA